VTLAFRLLLVGWPVLQGQLLIQGAEPLFLAVFDPHLQGLFAVNGALQDHGLRPEDDRHHPAPVFVGEEILRGISVHLCNHADHIARLGIAREHVSTGIAVVARLLSVSGEGNPSATPVESVEDHDAVTSGEVRAFRKLLVGSRVPEAGMRRLRFLDGCFDLLRRGARGHGEQEQDEKVRSHGSYLLALWAMATLNRC
jgi:hypothetical protein